MRRDASINGAPPPVGGRVVKNGRLIQWPAPHHNRWPSLNAVNGGGGGGGAVINEDVVVVVVLRYLSDAVLSTSAEPPPLIGSNFGQCAVAQRL